MKNIFYSLLATALIVIPTTVSAQQAAVLTNPLGTTDLRIIIARVISAILGVTGSIALLMFIYGGFMWLISAGDDKRVKAGKDTLKWATIGLVVIVAAYTLVSTIITALETGSVAG
jgi:hypothetical protein